MIEGKKKSFTESVYEFIKGVSGTPEAAPEAETTSATEGDDTSGIEAIYEALKTALDSGEVELEAGSITTWAKGKGLTDEQAQDLANTVLDGVDKTQSEPTGEPDGDESEMQKGVLKYLEGLDGNVKNFAKSVNASEKAITTLIAQNKKLSQEVVFLKSEINKISKTPVGVKNPATTISDMKPSKSGAEMIEAFSKGILKDQVLTIEDQHSYLTTGTLNEQSAKYMKEQGII